MGRSNVGKSSLINALVKQKIARTSAAPGKTRLANYYLIDSGLQAPGCRMYLVDLPGYGYARGGAQSAEAFEALTREYFHLAPGTRRHIAGILHAIDSRHPDLPHDAAAFQWLIRTQLPIAIVATKMDKLRRSDQSKTVRTLEKKYGVSILPESVMDGSGLDQIRRIVREWSSSPKPGL